MSILGMMRPSKRTTQFVPTHIDNEWYIFVANPDYEQCNSAIVKMRGVTIAI